MVSICRKGTFAWWGLRTMLTCGYKDKRLECSEGLCWLSEVVGGGSPSRNMRSLALSSWLGFQYQAEVSSCWRYQLESCCYCQDACATSASFESCAMSFIAVVYKHHSLIGLWDASLIWEMAWCVQVPWKLVLKEKAFRSVQAQKSRGSAFEAHGVFSDKDLPYTSTVQARAIPIGYRSVSLLDTLANN